MGREDSAMKKMLILAMTMAMVLLAAAGVCETLRVVEKKMDGPDNYVIHGSQSDSRADIKVSVENEKEAVKRWNA